LLSVLSLATLAQSGGSPACEACSDEGYLPCGRHPECWEETQRLGLFFEWSADQFSCCKLLGIRPCSECPAGAALDGDTAIEQGHYEWRDKVWGTFQASTSVPLLRDLCARLAVDECVASTEHFFLVADPVQIELGKRAHGELREELEELEFRFPHIVNSDSRLEPPETTLLFLDRCERTYRDFVDYLGISDDSQVRYSTRRIEVFPLFGRQSYETFQQIHNGSSRVWSGPERFAIPGLWTDASRFKSSSKLPQYAWMHNVLVHRTVSCLLSRYMTVEAYRPRVPIFLHMGLAHVFEIELSNRAVWFSETSELATSASFTVNHVPLGGKNWDGRNWDKQMVRLVKSRRKAPKVHRLTTLQVSGADVRFEDHVASWSLVTYLHQLGTEPFREYLDTVREGVDAAQAFAKVYGMTEQQLTRAWHEWVLATNHRGDGMGRAKAVASTGDHELIADDFDEAWEERKRSKDHSLIGSAIRDMRFIPIGLAAPRLFRVLREGDEIEAEAAVMTLRQVVTPEMAKVLHEEIQANATGGRNMPFWRNLVRASGAFAPHARLFVGDLIGYVEDDASEPDTRSILARALGELGDERATDALVEMSHDIRPFVRADATMALASISSKDAKERALELINDESWHVRIASIGVFRGLREWDTVPVLIERLGKESGRLREDIGDTLVDLTRKDFPPDHAPWYRWWLARGSQVEGPEDDESGVASRTRAEPATPDFLGEIYSKKVLFVIDVSGSMNQNIYPLRETKRGRRRGAPTTKAHFVFDALKKIVKEELDGDVMFNFLKFALRPDPWKDNVVEATSGNRTAAETYLTYFKAGDDQLTNLERALDWAFELANRKLGEGTDESAIDTMYLITDGSPTDGKASPDILRSWVRERNRRHKIRINVVTIGATDSDVDFLEALASDNFGACLVVTDN
jgi:hypothetical protein